MKRALLLLLALIIAAHYFWTDDWILLSGGHNGPRTSHTRPQFSLPLRFGQEEQEMLQRIRLTRLLAPGPRGSRIRG